MKHILNEATNKVRGTVYYRKQYRAQRKRQLSLLLDFAAQPTSLLFWERETFVNNTHLIFIVPETSLVYVFTYIFTLVIAT